MTLASPLDDGQINIDNGTSSEDQKNNNDKLTWTTPTGETYTYHPKPMTYSCLFILIQEMCERLAYYGLQPTLKLFLQRTLPGFTDAKASAYLGNFNGIMYLTPMFSAALADTFLGCFRTILYFSFVYMAGLALLVLASIDTMSEPWMVHVGLLVLVTIGSGGIKSCVNVLGGQQFHPEEHKDGLTSFFTMFYAVINIGAIVGGFVVPQVASSVSYFVAYLIPLGSFVIATLVFLMGTNRYIVMKPRGSPVVTTARVLYHALRKRSFEAIKASNGGTFEDHQIDDTKQVLKLTPLFLLAVPLLIAYQQMATAYLTQAEKMDNRFAGTRIAPALMITVDPLMVCVASVLVDKVIYAWYERRYGHLPHVLLRFAIGNVFCTLSLLCAYFVEREIMSRPLYSVSIWLQVPQFVSIALAGVFCISTSYEVAFTYAPPPMKAVSSGLNLVFFSLSGFASSALFAMFEFWMPDFDEKDSSTYKDAHYDYYFLVLCAVSVVGCVYSYFIRFYFDVYIDGGEKSQLNDSISGDNSSRDFETMDADDL
eukprot:PhM_4_TR18714/c0_g1_i4/m.62294/K14638/SLC15A3_4, PHT; solute carrier family 15 (peptide/histidine transporter), member 3/4